MRHQRKDFIAGTLVELSGVLKRAIFTSHYVRFPGLLQGIDPRIKVLTFIAFLLAALTTHRLEIILCLYLLSLALAKVSGIPLGFFIKRVWVFIPIFTGIIAIPAIFNFITPGRAIVSLIIFSHPLRWGFIHLPAKITITEQGLQGAAIFTSRVATSVSFTVLLTLTTEWMRLLKALSKFHFPKVGILILGMTYRYIFFFLQMVEDMFLAGRSRSIGHTGTRGQHRWIAGRLGFLLGKSYQLSNEVYLAMLSRGWNGQARLVNDFSLQRKDIAWTAFVLGVMLLIGFWEIR
jgi:cobalt/nickel transport system permease protein